MTLKATTFRVKEPTTIEYSVTMRHLATCLALVMGCNDSVAPTRTPPATPVEGTVEARCERDADCTLVEVSCASPVAVHRSLATVTRVQLERERATEQCRVTSPPWPESRGARCEEARCVPDLVAWPALRVCATASDCTLLRDECFGAMGVHRSHAGELAALVAAPAVRAQCEAQREVLRGLDNLLDPTSEAPGPTRACVAGSCRP